MKKTFIILFNLVFATVVYAASGHGGGHQASFFSLDFLFRVINFIILFGGIGYAISKPMKSYLKQRSENIRNQILEAKKAKEDAEAKARYYEEKLRNLQNEIEALKEQFKREAEEEKERISKEYQEQIEKFKERMIKSLEQEKLKIREELLLDLGNMAFEVAEDLVKKNFTSADQSRLVKEYITMMERVN
ncbi:MAG: ATP synthase F0 subunit B [Proteobacteria bacterium]|nr:ATP synthase F0 subunit B [Pseudomonadota bacterium]